jgi:hypothetical protein
MDLKLRRVAEAGASNTAKFSIQVARHHGREPYRDALRSMRFIPADSQGDARCDWVAEGSGRFLRRLLEAA